MKLLLTSAGFRNRSIVEAAQGMMNKPINKSKICIIPTAHNPVNEGKEWLIDETFAGPRSLGWAGIEVVDVAAMTSLPRSYWWPWLEDADVLLVGGGNPYYLSYWLQQSGVFADLPGLLPDKLYVGISAGSMMAGGGLQADQDYYNVKGQPLGKSLDQLAPVGQGSDKTLGFIPQTYRPHYNQPDNPQLQTAAIQNLATAIGQPIYACDDDTALKVVDGDIEVISEGKWELLRP